MFLHLIKGYEFVKLCMTTVKTGKRGIIAPAAKAALANGYISITPLMTSKRPLLKDE